MLPIGPQPFSIFATEAAAVICADKYNKLEAVASGDWTYRAMPQPSGSKFLVAAYDEDGEFVAYMEALK